MFYNIVNTELQSFTPDKIYNVLKFMLNPFVQLKQMQYLNMNYFETREIICIFPQKKSLCYNV